MYAICRVKYGYFDFIMVLHIISYKINHCRDLHQFFSCLFETFGTMSEIMFSSDSMSKKIFFQQLKIHECLLSVSNIIVLEYLENHCFGIFGKQWFKNVRITGISSFTIADSN